LYSFGIQSAYPAAIGIKVYFSALACADIPPFLRGISLDCGCKGNVFFGTDKLFY